MYPILFTIGKFPIYTYGVLIFLGILFGFLVSAKEAKRVGLDAKLFSDIFFWILVWSFVGARIFYIIVSFKYPVLTNIKSCTKNP